MSYSSIVEMTRSPILQLRVAACAADEGYTDDAQLWARNNIWAIVTADNGWAAAWDSARANASDNYNPDTGARDDVVTDAMILAVVQPMLKPPPPPEMNNELPAEETAP